MKGDERWRNNLRALAPKGTLRVELPRSRSTRSISEQGLRRLPAGTTVVLSARGPRAGRRCRGAAVRAEIALEREYLAFPSVEAPAYLVENTGGPVSVFVQTVLAAPPRSSLALPIQMLVGILRLVRAWGVVGLLAPGRVAVGRRV